MSDCGGKLRPSKDSGTEEAGKSNGGAWFYVNRVGFPMDDSTWDRMWDYAAKLHPSGAEIRSTVRSQRLLPEVPVPHVPLSFMVTVSVPERLESIQRYLKQLQYNHTGTQFFDIKKNRPICGLMDCAREMIRESLPIKCLEAVILAVYLTNYFPALDRFPISFRSVCRGSVHRHVVLGVHYNGRYGAVGMSRREDLMHKPLTFEHLSQLISDFNDCYRKCGHVLDKVKLGLTIPHDSHTYESIQWRALTLNMKRKPDELTKEIDRFSREIRRQTSRYQSATCVNIVTKPGSSSPKRPAHQGSQSAEVIRTNIVDNNRLTRDRRALAAATNSVKVQPGDLVNRPREKRLKRVNTSEKDETPTDYCAARI